MSARSLLVVALLTVSVAVALTVPETSSAGTPPTGVHAVLAAPVGALFFPSLFGTSVLLGLPHDCSASVVHSPGHNIVLTAAHCVAGIGIGYDFVPGYHDRLAPYGIWSAHHVYVNPQWKKTQDPQHDYAFLLMNAQIRHGVRKNIEDVTGAYTLGAAPGVGTSVTVDGYLLGVGDKPLTCTTPTYLTGGFPSFDCAGYGNGTSGGPWLNGTSVVGVIGGLHKGGCSPAPALYTSAFGADTVADLARAGARAPADTAPIAFFDDCPA